MSDQPNPVASVRPATDDDALDVRRVLDAAVLAYDGLDARIEADGALVATTRETTIAGVILLDPEPSTVVTGWDEFRGPLAEFGAGAHIDAIAVRKARRGRGVGTRLVETALDREGWLTAHFAGSVRPFYEALGFEVRPLADERFAGVRGHRGDDVER
ncbi:GNAT family N-acetyltransferase [Halovivax gelatinilyticus]|uniref:GNAT family N-acetyltransferase n=1 Tax=Halovivax gelatinilyticus TaxID=2961597 RepID=UPI0020CA8B21|nr:GNAT family N-acetyltransferase [Halovivax gelatinilyticus]